MGASRWDCGHEGGLASLRGGGVEVPGLTMEPEAALAGRVYCEERGREGGP